MTREEAITRLKGLYGNGYKKQEQALDMAIEALEQNTIQEKQAESEKYQKAFDDGYMNGYAQAEFDCKQEPKPGHWIKYDNEYCTIGRLSPVTRSIIECSACHTKIVDFYGKMYYCPYCGEPKESEGI